MKIILSPTKKVNVDTDSFDVLGIPRFIDDSKKLCSEINKFSFAEAKELWKCNEKLAELNYQRFQEMNLECNLTPAIFAYEGLAFQYMAPRVMTDQALNYLQEHLRILSAFYGVLTPFDGVVPYRLEMQAKLAVDGKKDLYDFWGERLYHGVMDEDRTIINLASKEYSQGIERYLQPKDRFITIEFGEFIDGKVKQKATFAKMARGEMVRFMAENQIKDLEQLKEFSISGYAYVESLSSHSKMVFIRG